MSYTPLFLYLSPGDCITRYAPVSGGSIDSKHQRSWLTDDRTGRPARATSGTNSWTVTCSGDVNFIAAANCGLDDGETIDVSGGVTATLTIDQQGDEICKNPWTYFTPAVTVASNLIFGVTGNSTDVVIGEVFAGLARELTRGTKPGSSHDKERRTTSPEGWSSVPGYDPRQSRWRHSYEVTVTKAQFDGIKLWEEQTYNGTLTSVIVPDAEEPDCYAVKFLPFTYVKHGPDQYDVSLNFLEHFRIKWNA